MGRNDSRDDDGRNDAETTTAGDGELAAARGVLARTVAGDVDPDEAAKRALGELAAHRVVGGDLHDDVREQLRNVLAVEDGEKRYFINQAKTLLDDALDDVDDDSVAAGPPESVRRTDDGRLVLELEVSEPLVEWMDLEAAENGHDSVEAWALTQLWVALERDLNRNHSLTSPVTVDISEDTAQRVALRTRLEDDGELTDVDMTETAVNYLDLEIEYELDGEPWPLSEESDDREE